MSSAGKSAGDGRRLQREVYHVHRDTVKAEPPEALLWRGIAETQSSGAPERQSIAGHGIPLGLVNIGG
jgi:hypothetical protein